jgi:hypothetical protein
MKTMKSLLAAAVIAIMLPSYANAGWLDIIKGIVGGVLGTAVQQQHVQQQPQQAQQPAPAKQTPASAANPAPVANAAPTEAEIAAALDSLTAACGRLSKAGLPCGIGIGDDESLPNALKMANTRSIAALGESIKASVTSNTLDIINKVKSAGVKVNESQFVQATSVAVESEVTGSQVYLSYTYKEDGEYKVMQLRVLNSAIFGNALEASSKGKSLEKQLIDKSLEGVTNKIGDWYKKNVK